MPAFTPRAWWGLLGWPGLVTLASLSAAWLAIGLAIAGHLKWSVLVALVAFVLDMADGFLARRLGVSSDYGRILDSLVDLVNYSLYAAVLVVVQLAPGRLGWALALLIMATGVMRLARFTASGFEDESNKYYRGVVTTQVSAAAMALLIMDHLVDNLRWVSVGALAVLAVAQLSGLKTRKTGGQAAWASLAIPLAIGAMLWLP